MKMLPSPSGPLAAVLLALVASLRTEAALPLPVHLGLLAGDVALPPPMPIRLATADAVVVGTVSSIEPRVIQAERFPEDQQGADYRVAVVKVQSALQGARLLTHVRVGFLAPPPSGVGGVGAAPLVASSSRRWPALEQGQEVCLFLMQHHREPFFVARGIFDIIDVKKDPTFKTQRQEMERAARLLADPMAGLRSRDPQDRYLTAALLIIRHRTPRPFLRNIRQEPIDAEESRLILQQLASASWTGQGEDPASKLAPPLEMFQRLGISEADGFRRPKDPRQLPREAQAWLEAHVGTYRIKRFTAEMPASK